MPKNIIKLLFIVSIGLGNSAIAEQLSRPVISFSLFPGSLEENVSALLEKHSDYQLLLWQVSKKHQVIVPANVTGRDVFHLLDQIISAYAHPAQLKASVYTKNKVIRIHYQEETI